MMDLLKRIQRYGFSEDGGPLPPQVVSASPIFLDGKLVITDPSAINIRGKNLKATVNAETKVVTLSLPVLDGGSHDESQFYK